VPTRAGWIIEARSRADPKGWKPVDGEKPRPRVACERDIRRWVNEPGDQRLVFRMRNVTTGQIVSWPPADST
jgi:hypothetical protein